MKITNEDYRSIQYFHEERGDLERWSGWEERKELIYSKHPELKKAYEDFISAERIMGIVVRSLEGYINYEEDE